MREGGRGKRRERGREGERGDQTKHVMPVRNCKIDIYVRALSVHCGNIYSTAGIA